MHAQHRPKRLVVVGLIAAAALSTPQGATADENPGLFGRIFRLGGSSNSAKSKPAPLPYGEGAAEAGNPAATGRNHNHNHDHPNGGAFIPPAAPRGPGPATGGGPATPEVVEQGSAPPITPRSRVSSAATDADPLLTRMALGRSNDGSQFGMFLQIYADGTVIDSEGVHRLAPADLRPIAELVSSGELGRNRGHCGTPSGDYIEEVHVVVYERRLGRLTAQPFSYSGNPQGCDSSVRQLHTLIENLQARLSGQPPIAGMEPMSEVPPQQFISEPDPNPAQAQVAAAPALASPAPASAFGAPAANTAPRSALPSGPAQSPFSSNASGGSRSLPPLPATAVGAEGPVIPLTPVEGP